MSSSLAEAREAWAAFVRKRQKTCPGVVASLEEGGDELLTFFAFPPEQWKCLRTTNAIERLNGVPPAREDAGPLPDGRRGDGAALWPRCNRPDQAAQVLAKAIALEKAT
jgi:hypothetical protein